MQDKWKDLIPFYVAGTLSDNQKNALEAYLAQCGDPCMDEVEAWRMIASTTWQTANMHATDLPPLSQAVRAEVAKDAELRASGKVISPDGFNHNLPNNVTNAPVAPPRVTNMPKKRRGPTIPLTMVAAFMTMVIFGGILISQLTTEDLEPTAVSLTEVADVELIITDDFGGEVGILPEDDGNDSGIIATPTPLRPQPTQTFSPTPLLPTSTPFVTATIVQPQPIATLPPNSNDGATTALMPIQGCTIRNETAGALTVYQNASFEAEPVGLFQQNAEASIRVQFDGWYELSYGRWVFGANVSTSGDCGSIITATPTIFSDDLSTTPANCIIRNHNLEPVNLYQWGTYDSPVNGQLAPGQSAVVYVGTNGWYQVFYAQWVNIEEITIENANCDNLWSPTPTLHASATPIPTLPDDASSGNPVAIVQSTEGYLLSAPRVNAPIVLSYAQGTNLSILAHNGVTGPQRWYLVSDISGVTGWVPALDVQVIPNDLDVVVAGTIPPSPTITPPAVFTPTPATPQIEFWTHVSTVVEQGCGGEAGVQSTIAVEIQRFDGWIQLTYPATGTSFTLNAVSPERYIGSYQTSATVDVDLTFTSPTGYIASEIITAESGCIVRSTWTGSW